MKVKSNAPSQSVTVTTYLPPPLVAAIDAVIAAEGGSRSSLLRTAVETCLTDLEWMRATHYRKKVALADGDHDAAAVERRIAELRDQHGPAPLSRHPRLEQLVKKPAAEKQSPPNGGAAEPAGGKAQALTVALDPELAARLAELTARESVTVSALLRGILARHLFRREWDEICEYGEQRWQETGITEAEVQRIIDEIRAEWRLWGSAARHIQYHQDA